VTVPELIRRKLVYVGLSSSDKSEAIRELVQFMIDEGELSEDQREPVLKAVYGRERFMSTGMEHGIALPHGVTDVVPEELAAIGLSRDGVGFDSMDGHPTHIVILLLTPTLKALTRVRTLAKIAELINDAEIRRRLIEAPDRESALSIILGNCG
jgi:mannitol/fructose-specific phosphotransferase system IIA component (Ntr-type)